MRVQAYRNLHKDCWSVVALEGADKGRVIIHTSPETGNDHTLHIQDATFVVQPAGRARVLRERKKNVHAFVRGTLRVYGDQDGGWGTWPDSSLEAPETCAPWYDVTYNPYRCEYFYVIGPALPGHGSACPPSESGMSLAHGVADPRYQEFSPTYDDRVLTAKHVLMWPSGRVLAILPNRRSIAAQKE